MSHMDEQVDMIQKRESFSVLHSFGAMKGLMCWTYTRRCISTYGLYAAAYCLLFFLPN